MLYAIRRISDNKYLEGKISGYVYFSWNKIDKKEPRTWNNISAIKGCLTSIRNGALDDDGEAMTREEALDITICELEFRHVGDISYE